VISIWFKRQKYLQFVSWPSPSPGPSPASRTGVQDPFHTPPQQPVGSPIKQGHIRPSPASRTGVQYPFHTPPQQPVGSPTKRGHIRPSPASGNGVQELKYGIYKVF
jgi:hypothetical protein